MATTTGGNRRRLRRFGFVLFGTALACACLSLAAAPHASAQDATSTATPAWALGAAGLGVIAAVGAGAALVLRRPRPTGHDASHQPPRAATAPSAEQTIAGRYHLTRLLGEGGMKRVYLARDAVLQRDVALALIRTDTFDATTIERVRREALAMAKLADHSNVVVVHDIGEHEGRPFVTTEYLEGGSVRDLLAQRGALPLHEAVRIAKDITSALALAHSQQLVHRDIKPGNVWLTRSGTAKVGDFGLAIALDRSRVTAEPAMLGTVLYMAPEQARGGQAGPRSDLYSLGAVLYELLCGRPPFVADSPAAVLYQTVHEEPPQPSTIRPGLPKDLEDLTLHLLKKDPEERPESAAGVLERLEAISRTAGDDATASPPPPRDDSVDSIDLQRSIAALEASVRAKPPDLSQHANSADGTVTLMFVDMESSTPLAEQLGDREWLRVLHAYSDHVTSTVGKHGGTVVDTAGDGFLVVFSSARSAIRCAIGLQRGLASRDVRGQILRGRIGLHTGEAIKDAERFVGRHVHLAARVGAAAVGGEVLVSSVTRELVAGEEFAFGAEREIHLRGFSGSHRVVPVLWEHGARAAAGMGTTPPGAAGMGTTPPAAADPAKATGRFPVAVAALAAVAVLALGVAGVGVLTAGGSSVPEQTGAPAPASGDGSSGVGAGGGPIAAADPAGSLAYQGEQSGAIRIYVIEVGDYETARRLISGGNALGSSAGSLDASAPQRWPSWSASGAEVSYTIGDGPASSIAAATADGSKQRLVAVGGADCDWGTHGDMVFVSGTTFQEIHTVAKDGSNRRKLTGPPQDGNSPAFSPDGKRIVFTSGRDGNDEIYVMNADGSGQRRLTKNTTMDGNPSWSRDGKRIAFTSDRDGDLEVYSMKTDGTDQRRLTRSPGYDSNAVWSADSKWIAFTSTRDGNHEIYTMKADGTSVRRVTNSPGRDEYPNWSHR